MFFECAPEFPGVKELIESHKKEQGEENTTSYLYKNFRKTNQQTSATSTRPTGNPWNMRK